MLCTDGRALADRLNEYLKHSCMSGLKSKIAQKEPRKGAENKQIFNK